jgi:hypothetical protein
MIEEQSNESSEWLGYSLARSSVIGGSSHFAPTSYAVQAALK